MIIFHLISLNIVRAACKYTKVTFWLLTCVAPLVSSDLGLEFLSLCMFPPEH